MWPIPQKTPDLDTFTEEILNGKLHFLRSEIVILDNSNVGTEDKLHGAFLWKL